MPACALAGGLVSSAASMVQLTGRSQVKNRFALRRPEVDQEAQAFA